MNGCLKILRATRQVAHEINSTRLLEAKSPRLETTVEGTQFKYAYDWIRTALFIVMPSNLVPGPLVASCLLVGPLMHGFCGKNDCGFGGRSCL